jgi:hypothetical protein
VKKTDQQRRRRIIGKLKTAICAFAVSNTLPFAFQESLEKTEWGVSLLAQLKFEEDEKVE